MYLWKKNKKKTDIQKEYLSASNTWLVVLVVAVIDETQF